MRRHEHSGPLRPYHEVMSYAANRARTGIAFIVLGVLGWLGACSDSPGGPSLTGNAPPDGLIISDPVAASGVTAPAGAGLTLVSSAGDSVVYVSLTPGTVSDGRLAIVRRVGAVATLTTAVIDGGFDPVPVVANVGESIEVLVRDASGSTIETLSLAVAAIRPPIIVRTDPPSPKTDVPINSVMVFVFSEPILASTLTSASVQLFRGTTSIAGTVSPLPGSPTAGRFVPNALLAPNTDYELVVTQAVRDLDGNSLQAPDTVRLTTGSTSTGPVASVTVVPESITVVETAHMYAPAPQIGFRAIARDANGNQVIGRRITWASSDPTIVRVDSGGFAWGLVIGSAVVTATTDGVTGSASVNVTPTVPVSLTIVPNSATLLPQLTVWLGVDIQDADGNYLNPDGFAISWRSENPAVAIVDNRGFVTAIDPGSTAIIATGAGFTDTATITEIGRAHV